MGILEDVIGKGPSFLDSSLFIYFIEQDQRYFPFVHLIFRAIDDGRLTGITSDLTLLETLVVPFRNKDTRLAEQYEEIFSQSKGLRLINLDRNLLRRAAFLRATFNLKTPDALQISAAKQEGCATFLTNDRRLPKVDGLEIIQLSSYVGS